MKIVFYLGPAFERWTPESAEQGGAGGAELFAARSAKELARRGHDVDVFADTDGPGWHDGVRWLQYRAWPAPAESAEILIVWRRPEVLDQDLSRFGRVYFMAQDNHYGAELTDARVAKVDRFMVISPWHQGLFGNRHPNTRGKHLLTRNGIDMSYYQTPAPVRDPNRVVYTSSPDRGLIGLLEAWPAVRKVRLTASLGVYYGFETLAARAEARNDTELKALIAKAWADMGYLKGDGVTFHGRVGQQDMADAYRRASVWVGPHAWYESYCQAAAEAQMAGCRIVAPARAALATTIQRERIWTGDLAADIIAALGRTDTNPFTSAGAEEAFGLGPVIDQWELEFRGGVDQIMADIRGTNRPALSASPILDLQAKEPDLGKVGPTPAGKMVEVRPARPTIGLCMIVRNESKRIRRCLESIRPFLDHWTIVDTGSEDGTQRIVTEVLASGLNPPIGRIHDRPWVNWHTNMGEAFALARGHTDYVWIIDADEEVRADGKIPWPGTLPDAFTLTHDYAGGVSFERMRILSSKLDWVQKGIGKMQIHEYPTVPDLGRPLVKATLQGVRVINHNDGNQGSLTPEARRERYRKEAENCEEALAEDPTNYRAAFYRGQSWKDAGEWDRAINAYEWRAGMVGGWDEETFVAVLEAAKLRARRGEKPEIVTAAFLRAWALRPWRAEPLCYLAGYMRECRNYKEALAYATAAEAIGRPTGDILFVDSTVYDWRIQDELCVAYYWTGEYQAALLTAQYLIDTGPADQRARFEANRDHAQKAIDGA